MNWGRFLSYMFTSRGVIESIAELAWNQVKRLLRVPIEIIGDVLDGKPISNSLKRDAKHFVKQFSTAMLSPFRSVAMAFTNDSYSTEEMKDKIVKWLNDTWEEGLPSDGKPFGNMKGALAKSNSYQDLLNNNNNKGDNSMGKSKPNKSDKSKSHSTKTTSTTSSNKYGGNHNPWYTKNLGASELINANFGIRKSINNSVVDLLKGNKTTAFQYADETTTIGMLPMSLVLPVDDRNSLAQAISIMYAKMRSANGGSINYSVDTLAGYVFNVRSARAIMAWLKRAIGLTNYNDPYDADAPKYLVDAALGSRYYSTKYYGTNFEAIVKEKANLINLYNTLNNTIKNLLPMNLALYERTEWMLSNVFKDSQLRKANYYMYTLTSFPKYTFNSSGQLVATYISLTPESSGANLNDTALENIIDNINTFISELANDNDYAIVAGDVLKAFGSGSFFNSPTIDANYVVTPVYDEKALTQIQNCTLTGEAFNGHNPSQTYTFLTGVNTLQLTRDSTISDIIKSLEPTNVLVNTYLDKVSSGDLLSMTRLSVLGELDTAGTTYTVKHCGTEIISAANYIRTVQNTQSSGDYIVYSSTNDIETGNAQTNTRVLNGWAIMDYGPLFAYYAKSATTGQSDAFAIVWDFCNYAVISTAELDNLHQIATISLLTVDSHITRQKDFVFLM